MELREAREAKAAREQKPSAVECLSPELAREDADSGHRLAGEKIRLEEEVSALRVQVERLSAASDGKTGGGEVASSPGSPADGQRPAVDETAVADANNATPSESNGDDAPGKDVGDGSSGRSGGGGGALTRRLVEAETERVLAELRANPPASTKALLLARAEMDACATEAVAKISATGLLPPPPSPPPSALYEDLGL